MANQSINPRLATPNHTFAGEKKLIIDLPPFNTHTKDELNCKRYSALL